MNRERLTILRDHLASLPDERVDMRRYFTSDERWFEFDESFPAEKCGTAACIAGWSSVLFNDGTYDGADASMEDLDLASAQWAHLCTPSGYMSGRYTRSDAISAIQSMLDSPDDDALPVWPSREGASA